VVMWTGRQNPIASPNLLQCMSPFVAQSRHCTTEFQCLLLGVKRTLTGRASMSAFDPKRTFVVRDYKATQADIRAFERDWILRCHHAD